MTVRLADQTQITIADCLVGVEIEYQGIIIKRTLYVHPNSDSEEISLGKGSMQLLGFTLSDSRGRNLWDASDPQSMDPEVSRQISQFFGRKADLGIPEESGQMESNISEPEDVAMFAC